MAGFLGDGKIYLIKTPIPARWGIRKYQAMLNGGEFGFHWNRDEIALITVNEKKTICKIFHISNVGISLTTRKLFKSKFSILFEEGRIPAFLSREELELMYIAGTCDKAES